MKKTWNFSAGPAMLPETVLKTVQEELLSYRNSGMSVMELSHRSSLFQEIIDEAEQLLRELMKIPEHYRVLFLQGGASQQFSMIPMNLLKKGKGGYIISGFWGEKAYREAAKLYGERAVILADSSSAHHTSLPTIPEFGPGFDYVHLTTNNTIEGTAYHEIPYWEGIPLVADMSSNILSADYRVEDFGMIYAGAQKNIGPAGLTIVIIQEDLLQADHTLPTLLDYRTAVKHHSLYHTPPTFGIYVAKRVLEWVKEQGGVEAMVRQNEKKSALLYEAIDASCLFSSSVEKSFRSLTNIPFQTGSQYLDALFIETAAEQGFVNLKGHRSVGGMRASIYNAFPYEGVEAFVSFLQKFEEQQGDKTE